MKSMKQIYSFCIPLVKAGDTTTISVTQSLGLDALKQDGDNTVHVKIDGPQIALPGDMIAGVFPSPGSEDSPDEFLPHVALSRRTLPWERKGPDADNDNMPWVALVLFKESELRSSDEMKQAPAITVQKLAVQSIPDLTTKNRLINTLKIPPTTEVQTLTVKNEILRKIMPKREELPLLCHMKRAIIDNAIVISNRLPDSTPLADNEKPPLHTAVLISVEQAPELFMLPTVGETTLIVLHQWTFRPTGGFDFEQVFKSIAYRPNGGVLRFGNLPALVGAGEQAPLSANFKSLIDPAGYFLEPLEHDQEVNATYRSPLRPFAPPPRSKGFAISAAPDEFRNAPAGTPLDFSHAAAFELGRLLALNDSAILDDLRDVQALLRPIVPSVNAMPLPPPLKKQDWATDPDWTEQPWAFGANESLVKDQNLFLDKGIGDMSGIKDHIDGWDIGSIVAVISTSGAVITSPVVPLNIDTIDGLTLDEQFADVAQVAKA